MNALIRNIVIAGLLLAGAVSTALAQPVQWRVEDGGNGHWYQVTTNTMTWQAAKLYAESVGGHLATLTSASENAFVASLQSGEVYLGGYQDLAAPDYAEPSGGWRWVTGEAWQFNAWHTEEPNNGSWPDGARGENYLNWWRFGAPWNAEWNDTGNANCACAQPAAIEWDADCNGDGIVDKGQILSGQLADANGNGVPDVCEGLCASWSQRTGLQLPPPRTHFGVAYDTSRSQTVLFGGGFSGPGPSQEWQDTWILDQTGWHLATTAGPGYRHDHAMCYDPARQRIVLFGGADQPVSGPRQTFGDTWEWIGTMWELKATTGPSPRENFAMAYDTIRGVTVIAGGTRYNPSTNLWDALADTWEWNGTSWTQTGGLPELRGGGRMAFDPIRSQMVLFGGGTQLGGNLTNTLVRTGTAWTTTGSGGPPGRGNHMMCWVPSLNAALLFGGTTGNPDGEVNDTWLWNGTAWQQLLLTPSPSRRELSGMYFDSTRNAIELTFGYLVNTQTLLNEQWELATNAPSITTQPVAQSVCPGGSGSFSVTAAGSNPTYQWQIEAAPGNWVTLGGTPQPLIFCSPSTPGMAFASNPTSPSTSISVRCFGAQHWNIRAVVTNACGSVNSASALLTNCVADYNCSGSVTVSDIFSYLSAWFGGAYPEADINLDQHITVQDIFAFLSAWFAGCP